MLAATSCLTALRGFVVLLLLASPVCQSDCTLACLPACLSLCWVMIGQAGTMHRNVLIKLQEEQEQRGSTVGLDIATRGAAGPPACRHL